MESHDSSVSGQPLGADRRRPRTFPIGRVCEHQGCTTRLSRYNSHTRCARHDFDVQLAHGRVAPRPVRHVLGTSRQAA